MRPPVFDSSATVACFDESTRTLFSADAFGGLVPRITTDIDDLGDEAYAAGCATFTLANSVWLHDVDRGRLATTIAAVRTLAPDVVLSSHAVPLRGRADALCDQLAAMPDMPPTQFPDDEAFQAMLAQMKAGGTAAAQA